MSDRTIGMGDHNLNPFNHILPQQEAMTPRVRELEELSKRAAKSLSEVVSLSNINPETKRLLQTIAEKLNRP